MKLLGSSKVTNNYRMQLVKAVRDIMDVEEGNIILFYEKEGEVVIKKG